MHRTLSSACSLLICILALFAGFNVERVASSALTTTISAHDRSCFYAWVDEVGEKVGFYFAVSCLLSFLCVLLQSMTDSRLYINRSNLEAHSTWTG